MVIDLRSFKNENIQDKLEIVPMSDRVRKNHFILFNHIHRRSIDASVRRTDCIEVTNTYRRRGGLRKLDKNNQE